MFATAVPRKLVLMCIIYVTGENQPKNHFNIFLFREKRETVTASLPVMLRMKEKRKVTQTQRKIVLRKIISREI